VTGDDHRWMGHALALARRGEGETNPNPMVGCVVVKGGRVVGEGWHERAGGPHAEVRALDAARGAARGATVYVTLEPCAHHGRTGPCADAVAAAQPARVVVAVRDPNPRVDGEGLACLRRAGLAVTEGVRAADAARLNEPFLVAAPLRRPYVLLKAALTLDGRIATARGESKWITSPAQRRAARALRRRHDAVAVGIGTALADDPRLLPDPPVQRRFVRVVFDSRLRLREDSRLVRSVRQGLLWVLASPGAAPARARRLEARGVTVIRVPGARERVPIPAALRELRRRGIWTLMVEGGADLLGGMLAARTFDEVALFRAPMILGGANSLPAFGGPDPRSLRAGATMTRTSPLLSRLAREAGAEGGGGAVASDPVNVKDPFADLFETCYPVR
jgi:diaminohydroxyphosphoribosylaminopyrimidine deaminase/5-amino-6-(5-phosphoribosylamino)uracil reductase